MYQDNQSAIRMDQNGRKSCTGNSRHVNIHYFFVKYRVEKKEIMLKYCPTHLVIGKYSTKPLQGKAFKIFFGVIMGYSHVDTFWLQLFQ